MLGVITIDIIFIITDTIIIFIITRVMREIFKRLTAIAHQNGADGT